jgi:DNA-binding beta-propeller fold protein YncE
MEQRFVLADGGMMRTGFFRFILLLIVCLQLSPAAPDDTSPLAFKAAVPLPQVAGRIDHFSADAAGHRLFMSALGNRSVEVIDTQTFRLIHSIPNFNEPQGIVFDNVANRLFIASGGDGSVKVLNATNFQQAAVLRLGDDADNVRYDATRDKIIVGYGSGGLAVLKSDGTNIGEVKLGAHPESFQVEKEGHRLFVNVPDKLEIAVIDLDKNSVVARWHEWKALANFPMALDERHDRLFVGFRVPPRLLAVDTNSGKVAATADIVGDTDDIFYDAVRQWVYVIGGGGFLDVLDVKDPAHFRRLAHIATAAGARTGLFVPEWDLLFVGIPARGSQKAEVRAFELGSNR